MRQEYLTFSSARLIYTCVRKVFMDMTELIKAIDFVCFWKAIMLQKPIISSIGAHCLALCKTASVAFEGLCRDAKKCHSVKTNRRQVI